MPLLRRKRLPAGLAKRLEAFRAVVAEIDAAKDALTDAVPSTRMPGRPLAEALVAFEEHVRTAHDRMRAWRAPGLETEWLACREALERSLGTAERLRLEASDPAGFEGLIATIGDLLDPLDAFEAASDRFRALRS